MAHKGLLPGVTKIKLVSPFGLATNSADEKNG